jgi:hypothetical protein
MNIFSYLSEIDFQNYQILGSVCYHDSNENPIELNHDIEGHSREFSEVEGLIM